jgi:hypothetical protein
MADIRRPIGGRYGDGEEAGGASTVDLTDGGQWQGAPAAATSHRHDPRVDPPDRKDRRRVWLWMGLLAFCPICLGVVVWASLDLNGNYPTIKPPVPSGWQAVPGIYASFSLPSGWSLQQEMSDSAGDIYYSGPGGGAGESVQQVDSAPSPQGPLPSIVGTFLETSYRVTSAHQIAVKNATVAWSYQFHLADGRTATGVMAWVKPTQSEIWLVLSPVSPTTEKVLSTLTLAS